VSLELVHRPANGPVDIGTGFSHLAVQIDNLKATVEALTQAGLRPGPIELPGGPDGPQLHGSPTPTAIGSSWSNGHPGIPMASPRPTSLASRPIDREGDAARLLSAGRDRSRAGTRRWLRAAGQHVREPLRSAVNAEPPTRMATKATPIHTSA